MPANLFLRDQLLAPVPEEALAAIVALAADLGCSTHWDQPQETLYVDSPLSGRVIACTADAPPAFTALAGELLSHLIRRIQAAGGLATYPGASACSAAASVYMQLEPAPDDGGLAVAVCRGWLPAPRRLGACIASCLGAATHQPVGLFSRWPLLERNRVHLRLYAPAPDLQADWAETIAAGICLGLMRYLRRRWYTHPAVRPRATIPAPARAPAPAPAEPDPYPPPAPVVDQPCPCPPPPVPLPVPPLAPRPRPRLKPEASAPLYTWTWSISTSHWELLHTAANVTDAAMPTDEAPDAAERAPAPPPAAGARAESEEIAPPPSAPPAAGDPTARVAPAQPELAGCDPV